MFYFGADYYPEQWPIERWPIDAALMAEAGFNVVRLAEFAWSKMEPEQGRFDFDWLDAAMAVLQEKGIRVILGTPTASAPPWLMQPHPELFRVREDGLRVTYGNRRAYCPNQPLYHEHTRRIVTEMARRYGHHPAVIGWQIDNEFGERCYCPTCREKFQDWLKNKYGSLYELNGKWGTVFWSHVYNDWSEIPIPLAAGGSPNPSLALDYARFCSDSYVAYQKLQLDILKPLTSNQFFTHNFMGIGFDKINYFDLACDLDFVSVDHYPRSQWSHEQELVPARFALSNDFMRGLKKKNFWVMEQQAGAGGWEYLSLTPRPGELRLWAYQSIAHGADAIVFFRWRTARFGTEQYWHGLLDHDARPGRRYGEAKRMGQELKQIGDVVAGSTIHSQVAIMISTDSRFSFQVQPQNTQFHYEDHLFQVYRCLHHRHISVDLVSPQDDLSGYKLVIAPALHVVDERIAGNLAGFVRAGGRLVLTQRTGVKDEHNAVVDQRLPGLLAELSGVEVDEYDSLNSRMSNSVEFLLPELIPAQASVGGLCDILKPTTAGVLARYTGEFYAGEPAVTLNRFGAGQVLYIGAVGGEKLYDPLLGLLLRECGIAPLVVAVPCLEVTERWQGDRRLFFILNLSDSPQSFTLDQPLTNLLDGCICPGEVTIAPLDVMVLTI